MYWRNKICWTEMIEKEAEFSGECTVILRILNRKDKLPGKIAVGRMVQIFQNKQDLDNIRTMFEFDPSSKKFSTFKPVHKERPYLLWNSRMYMYVGSKSIDAFQK
jgi:hypothetical protein